MLPNLLRVANKIVWETKRPLNGLESSWEIQRLKQVMDSARHLLHHFNDRLTHKPISSLIVDARCDVDGEGDKLGEQRPPKFSVLAHQEFWVGYILGDLDGGHIHTIERLELRLGRHRDL